MLWLWKINYFLNKSSYFIHNIATLWFYKKPIVVLSVMLRFSQSDNYFESELKTKSNSLSSVLI